MGAVQTRVEHPNFETVWAVLQEVAERQKETDRIANNNAHIFKRLDKFFGDEDEYIVLPDLMQKFREMGFEFTKAYHRADIADRVHKIYTEIDITLENGDKVMIVEVKSKPTTENITEHIERMEKVRQHGNLHGDGRAFLGAIAGMIVNDNVKEFALKSGFYVIEPSGETFIITAPEGEYSPREW